MYGSLHLKTGLAHLCNEQDSDLHTQPAAQCLRCAWLGPESPADTAEHLPDNDYQ